jgi:hypothetical protein
MEKRHNRHRSSRDNDLREEITEAIIYSVGSGTKAAYREETDHNHVRLVATINLSGQKLKPLYLMTKKAAIREPELRLLSGYLALYQTSKEY